MSLKETLSGWKKQAEEEAERNMNRQGQNDSSNEPTNNQKSSAQNPSEQDQSITISLSELQSLLDSAAQKAVEKKSEETQNQESGLETRIEETKHQLNQFRLKQEQKNESLKKETEQLKKDTKDSFDGLGNLIQEKLKPLDELNQRMTKQLPPKPSRSQPDRNQLTDSTKKNTSDNWSNSDSSSYSISHPSVTYIPKRKSNEPDYFGPRSRTTSLNYQEPELRVPRWMEWVEAILQIPFFILWLIWKICRGIWLMLQAAVWVMVVMPEVFFTVLMLFMVVSIALLLIWGVPYAIKEMTDQLRMSR